MKPLHMIALAVAVGGAAMYLYRRQQNEAIRNDASGPRLPGMPAMPSMPKMPGMPSMASGAAPNAPRVGPQAPSSLFAGMWG